MDGELTPQGDGDLYCCDFSADQGKFGCLVVAYNGGSLSEVCAVEMPEIYDLRADLDEITSALAKTDLDFATARAA